jgi:hypothetical protein
MSAKRKKLLKELADNTGTTSSCPYCDVQIEKLPKRKAKCKSCKAFIYPRKEPLSGKLKLYREGDLFLLEELKALKDGWWQDWYKDNEVVLKAREDLAKEWNVDEVKVSIADAQWRCLNTDIIEGTEKRDWGKVFDAYSSMLRQLKKEERQDASPLNEIVAGFMFTGYGPHQEYSKYNLYSAQFKLHRPQFMLIEQLSTDVDEVFTLIKDTRNSKSYSNLMNVTVEEIFERYKTELNEEAELSEEVELSETFVPKHRTNKTNVNVEKKSKILPIFISLIFIVAILMAILNST